MEERARATPAENAAPVFVTGGSGFVGAAVIAALLARGYRVHALVHRRPIEVAGVTSFTSDLLDASAVARAMSGCGSVVHLVGIIAETPGQTFQRMHVDATAAVVHAARSAGIRRFVQMSALGARTDSASAYARTKAQGERLVRDEPALDWTVFRPSIIHGPDGAFVRQMVTWARGTALPYAFMPYFGTGFVGHTSRHVQPVDVRDVGRAFADAVDRPALAGQVVDLVGSQAVTWPQMYQVVSETTTGRLKPAVGLPVWYAKAVATLVPNRFLPLNKSQVVMAGEDSVADVAETTRQLGWQPRAFPEAFREYGGRL